MKRHITESERMAQAVLTSLYKRDLLESVVFEDVEGTPVTYGPQEVEGKLFLRRLQRTLTFTKRRWVDSAVRIHLHGIQIKDSPKARRESSYWRVVPIVEVARHGDFRKEGFFFKDWEKLDPRSLEFDRLLGSSWGTHSYGTFYQVR